MKTTLKLNANHTAALLQRDGDKRCLRVDGVELQTLRYTLRLAADNRRDQIVSDFYDECISVIPE